MKVTAAIVLLTFSTSVLAQETDVPYREHPVVIVVDEGRLIGTDTATGLTVAADVGRGIYLNVDASVQVAREVAGLRAENKSLRESPFVRVAPWQAALVGGLLLGAGVGAGVFLAGQMQKK